jgi:hypothetical protein
LLPLAADLIEAREKAVEEVARQRKEVKKKLQVGLCLSCPVCH